MDSDHIDGWEEQRRREILAYIRVRETDPTYPETVAAAADRGYAPAPMWMMLDGGHLEDLYPWCGSLWVKKFYVAEG